MLPPATKIRRLALVGVTRPIEGTWHRQVERIPDGRYTPDELIGILKDGWISYWECHKCGWFDTCPHPERFPEYPQKARDIQCKVTITAMRNFLIAWWSRVLRMTPSQRSDFFEAFFFFTQYFIDAYIGAGTLVNNLDVGWWGPEMALSITTSPLHTRVVLNQFAESIEKLPFRRYVADQFVFVEGESEEEFLLRLRDLRFLPSHIEIECIQGKGNAKPSRLPLRLLKRRGYPVSLQLDGDSGREDRYRELREMIERHGGSIFVFKRDFESAFPAPFLHAALSTIGVNVDLRWLEGRTGRGATGPLVRDLEAHVGAPVPKVKLARRLADFASEEWSTLVRQYRRSEITCWLMALRVGPGRRRRTAQSGVERDGLRPVVNGFGQSKT